MGILKTIGEVLKFVSIEVIPFANLVVTTINNWKKKKDEQKF